MKKQVNISTRCLVLAVVLTACNSGAIQTVEVTRLIPQTVEVTRIIPQTAITTQKATATTPESAITTITAIQPVQDSGYYDSIIVITQYYTFLGNGLYEKAYYLLSPAAQKHESWDEYIMMGKNAFKTVEIISIEPFFVAVEKQGGHSTPDPEDKKRFVVQIKTWGVGRMSGAVLSGDLQMLFLTLVRESDGWKIDSFATGPLP